MPHSEIPGSTPACGSPRLFAAFRVLLRHLAPRHPPCALPSLISLRNASRVLAFACSLCSFQGTTPLQGTAGSRSSAGCAAAAVPQGSEAAQALASVATGSYEFTASAAPSQPADPGKRGVHRTDRPEGGHSRTLKTKQCRRVALRSSSSPGPFCWTEYRPGNRITLRYQEGS